MVFLHFVPQHEILHIYVCLRKQLAKWGYKTWRLIYLLICLYRWTLVPNHSNSTLHLKD